MRVLKWLFHPVYLLVFIVVVALYINRDTVISEFSQSDEVAALIGKMDGIIDSLQDTREPDAEEGTTQAVLPMEQGGTLSPPASNAEPADVPTFDTGVLAGSAGAGDDTGQRGPVSSNHSMDAEADKAARVAGDNAAARQENAGAAEFVSAAVFPPRQESEVEGSDSQPVLANVTADEIMHTWQQARVSAWRGDFPAAIEHYQTVVTLQQDNFDAYGEMGNVMLRSGDRQGAAEAYYQTALLINKTPQPAVAWKLLNVVAGLDPQKAEKLYQELTRP